VSAAHILREDVRAQSWAAWAPVLAGLALLYVPTYVDIYHEFWSLHEQSAAPVMLLLVGWLAWRERAVFATAGATGARLVGSILFAVGVVLYVLGRSQTFYQLEVASQIPLLLGVVGILLGSQGLRRLWFPTLLLLCLVPVPGSALDQLLLPLKELVSDVVDNSLHLAGYPSARSGAVLSIGPYNLLIADACSGLNSMLALSGVGLFYVYLSSHERRWIKAALLLSILPVAFLANIVRVAGLTLITFYAGESAGVSFHDRAAYLEILLAFGGFFAIERVLAWAAGGRADRKPATAELRPG
jgi:exosortase B